jgi:hypothetical protein
MLKLFRSLCRNFLSVKFKVIIGSFYIRAHYSLSSYLYSAENYG